MAKVKKNKFVKINLDKGHFITGGNLEAVIQQFEAVKNAIGETEKKWTEKAALIGWLGLQSGDSKYTSYNAKVEESTHVFLCDFDSEVARLRPENTRLIVKGKVYDIMLIDNPDEMDEQLEIYLKMVGVVNAED